MIKANRASNLLALVLAASLLVPSTAMATSLPYIDDVGGSGKVLGVQFSAAGCEKSLSWRVFDAKSGKRVKADRLSGRVGAAKLTRGRLYLISVKGAGTWKSVGFRAYDAGLRVPRVDDVSPWSKGKSLMTLYAKGKSVKYKVTDKKSGKRVKVEYTRNGAAIVAVNNGREYTISAKSAGKWRSIGYVIY